MHRRQAARLERAAVLLVIVVPRAHLHMHPEIRALPVQASATEAGIVSGADEEQRGCADRDIRDGAAAVLVLQPELHGRGLAKGLVATLRCLAGRKGEAPRLGPQLNAGCVGAADARALHSRQQRSAAAAAEGALREASMLACVHAS